MTSIGFDLDPAWYEQQHKLWLGAGPTVDEIERHKEQVSGRV